LPRYGEAADLAAGATKVGAVTPGTASVRTITLDVA
jgi:hypothetical protein